MNDNQRVVDRLLDNEIDVNDFGICRRNIRGKHIAYKVEEEDGEINWYVNPSSSDTILYYAKVDFVRER